MCEIGAEIAVICARIAAMRTRRWLPRNDSDKNNNAPVLAGALCFKTEGAAYFFFFGIYRSVIEPCAISAAKAMVSDMVGWA